MQKRFLIFSFFSLVFFSVFSQWTSDPAINTPVCTAVGKQIDLRMLDDGQGGTFIAWKDYRPNGIPDIYIQHIDSLGNALWQADGVPLCTDSADQSTPSIISDMRGGAIVAWSDWRSNIERDLYAQRINAAGVVMWKADGVIVTNKQEREHSERMVSDGKGGAIIVWEQQNGQWDIWAQHLDSAGYRMWGNGGIPVFNVNANRINAKIQEDKKGGAYIVCQDERNLLGFDIYIQHVDSNGTTLWGNGAGLSVCSANAVQINPKIDPDKSSRGVIVAWADKRNGFDYDIFSQRIDSVGNMLWASDGIPVASTVGNQSAVDLFSSNAVGGCIYTWKDDRNGTDDIYAQKLDTTGAAAWTNNGIIISNAIRSQINPNITGDGNGGAIICWQDSVNNEWDIYSQAIDVNGNVLWATNGLPVSIAFDSQTSAKNISDKHGGSIYAWQDKRTGTFDIYCHHIYWGGFSAGTSNSPFIADINVSPNPFSQQFTINYTLHKTETISARIFDMMGKEVLYLCQNEVQAAGNQSLIVDAILPNGVYFLYLSGKGFTQISKIVKGN